MRALGGVAILTDCEETNFSGGNGEPKSFEKELEIGRYECSPSWEIFIRVCEGDETIFCMLSAFQDDSMCPLFRFFGPAKETSATPESETDGNHVWV